MVGGSISLEDNDKDLVYYADLNIFPILDCKSLARWWEEGTKEVVRSRCLEDGCPYLFSLGFLVITAVMSFI